MSPRRWRLVAAVALAAFAAVAAGLLLSASSSERTAFKLDKRYTDHDAFGSSARESFGNYGEPEGENEATAEEPSPTSGAEEDFAHRAYPLDYIPVSATLNARQSWASYKENKDGSSGGNNPNDPLVWNLIGPTKALQPGELSFSGAPLHMAGRTVAVAITPNCSGNSDCRLWIAAAGGGIWRTDNPFSPDPKWVFVSQPFGTNAIGTLDQDLAADPSGNTLYAGTGESHASVDSEAGIGIYKTTDGGDTWTFLPGSNLFATRAISKIVAQNGHLYVGVARGVRGVSSVVGGAISRTAGPNDGPDQAPLGLYESTDDGTTFKLIWDSHGSVRGVNDVAVDGNNGNAIYAASYQNGIWRCAPQDGCNVAAPTSGQFKQVFAATSPAQNTDRAQFALTVKDGATRIYVEDGAVGNQFIGNPPIQIGFPSQVWRADNANAMTAAQLLASQAAHAAAPSPNDPTGGWALKSQLTDSPRSGPYRPAYNPCTGQCWYDAEVYTPEGYPDIVYVLGSYQYGELRGPSNGRGVLLSTTAGDPDPEIGGGNFSDLTWDDTSHPQPSETHPDQHAIVTPTGQPFLYFEGSDGGMVRSDGQFDDASDDCAQYHPAAADPDSQLLCRRLLSRVPHQIYDELNKGLSTLQFQSVSLSPKQPLHDVQGGTQDNGTFDWDSQSTTWKEIMYGDGGQSGFNYCDDKIRFNEFTNQATDENFRDGQIKYWVVTSGPLSTGNGGESAPFYAAIVSDYTNCGSVPGFNTPAAIAANSNQTTFAQQNGGARLGYLGFQYIGMNHVWRTVDNGGPQDYLETNCPEFTTSFADPRCGDWKPLGGPRGVNNAGSLTGTFYGVSKLGGNVAAVERNPSDNGTAWAATTLGRVFITHNINAVDPNAVVWQRVDTIAVTTPPNATPPTRFVSSIYPDPSNLNRAFVAYSGYNSATPSTPGHVFEVTVAGATATFRDLHVEQGSTFTTTPVNGDLPITDLVRDDYTLDLYAATDFGVVRGVTTNGGATYTWAKAGSANFPFVEVPGLTIDPCSRALYAATHGRSIWRMFLPPVSNAPNKPCPRTP